MKKLLKNGVAGVAALLLAAAAIALLVFAFATLLGVAAVLGLVAAGVLIGAPADAKTLIRNLMGAISKWVADFERIVASAGETMLTLLGKHAAQAPADGDAATASSAGEPGTGASVQASDDKPRQSAGDKALHPAAAAIVSAERSEPPASSDAAKPNAPANK